jgi:hypothetical protein
MGLEQKKNPYNLGLAQEGGRKALNPLSKSLIPLHDACFIGRGYPEIKDTALLAAKDAATLDKELAALIRTHYDLGREAEYDPLFEKRSSISLANITSKVNELKTQAGREAATGALAKLTQMLDANAMIGATRGQIATKQGIAQKMDILEKELMKLICLHYCLGNDAECDPSHESKASTSIKNINNKISELKTQAANLAIMDAFDNLAQNSLQ